MNSDQIPCTGNHCSNSKKYADLESGKYLATPSNLEPITPCSRSLFDVALCGGNDNTTVPTRRLDLRHLERHMDQVGSSSIEESETPATIPRPHTGPIPIPIQHCGHGASLQRPAKQFSSSDGNEKKEEATRPNSLKELVAAVRNRRTLTADSSVQRRLHDFERARHLRRDRYQTTPPWGILGMYEHLSGIRVDLRWAEQCALRRANGENYVGWADYVQEHENKHYNNRPIFIVALTTLSTIMMVYTMYLGNWEFAPLDVNPMIGPHPQALLDAGALNTYLLVVENQWWRLFVPLVLHAGFIHFGIQHARNLVHRKPTREIHGFCNISSLFIISAVGGNILSALFQPDVISVGASGGIFGLVGVCLADIFVNWDLLFLKLEDKEDDKTTWNHIKVLFWLFFDVVVNVIIGLTPFVDNYAHLGGFLYGIFYALPLVDRLGMHFFGQLGFCFKVRNCTLRLFGFMAGCGLLLATSLLLLKSDGYTSPCDSCRFISCAPFPFWKEDKWWDCSSS